MHSVASPWSSATVAVAPMITQLVPRVTPRHVTLSSSHPGAPSPVNATVPAGTDSNVVPALVESAVVLTAKGLTPAPIALKGNVPVPPTESALTVIVASAAFSNVQSAAWPTARSTLTARAATSTVDAAPMHVIPASDQPGGSADSVIV